MSRSVTIVLRLGVILSAAAMLVLMLGHARADSPPAGIPLVQHR